MKKFAAAVLTGFFLIPEIAFAETESKPHFFEIGTELYDYSYKEPGVMENDGAMYGVNASYTYRDRFMFRLKARTAWGEHDYTSANTGSASNIDDFAFEFRTLGGIDYSVNDLTITPYVGFGYRYLNDDSAGRITTTGALGYERESNYYYSPIGIKAVHDFKNAWKFGATLEYDLFWSGEQKSHLGDAIPGFGTLINEQNDGWGTRFSLFLKRESAVFRFKVEGFFRYWKIDDSEIYPIRYYNIQVGYGWEPENETRETGLKLSILF